VLLYVGARALGKVGGAYLTGRAVGAAPVVRRRVGLSLMPQAGVALGFALLAQQELPEIGEQLINVVIASTVLFEITGPILLRRQLAAAGEIPHARG
jgi:Kef-type K+ transport system membrane component KefB